MNWINENFIYFLAGLIFCIPLSILANVLTPRFQNWYAKRSYKKAQKRIYGLNKELNVISNFAQSKEDLILYGIESILVFFLAFVFAGILQEILFKIAILEFPMDILIYRFLGITGFIIVALSQAIGTFAAINCWRKINSVRNFEKFQADIENEKEKLAQIQPDKKEVN